MYHGCAAMPATAMRKSGENCRVEVSRNLYEMNLAMFDDQSIDENHRHSEYCRMQNQPHRRRRKPSRDDILRCQHEISYEHKQPEQPRLTDKKFKYRFQHCPSCHCDDDLLNFPSSKNRYSTTKKEVYRDYEKSDAPQFVKKIPECPTTSFIFTNPADAKNNDYYDFKNVCDKYSYIFPDNVKLQKDANYHQDQRDKSNTDIVGEDKYVRNYVVCKEEPQCIPESCEEEMPSSFQEAEVRVMRSCSKDEENDKKLDMSWLEMGHNMLKKSHYESCEYEQSRNFGQNRERSPEKHKKKVNFTTAERQNLLHHHDKNLKMPPTVVGKRNGKSPDRSPTKSAVPRVETSLKRNSTPTDMEHVYDMGESDECLEVKQLEHGFKNFSCCFPQRRHSGDRRIPRCSKRQQTIEDSSARTNEGGPLVGAGEVDLYTNKNYIVDLIDRALSKELGNQSTGDKNEPSLPEEHCRRKTPTFQDKGTPTHVEELKSLRWEYIEHIQEDVQKLSDLQKFLDNCVPATSGPHIRAPETSAINNEHSPSSAKHDPANSVS